MSTAALCARIQRADALINSRDFAALADFYTEDALLVLRPGLQVNGRIAIIGAFERIAAHFGDDLQVRQSCFQVLATGDTALVLARLALGSADQPVAQRQATYVFRREADDQWRCAVDNSYGTGLLDAQMEAAP